MDALRYLISSLGGLTYNAVYYGTSLLPQDSRRAARLSCDKLESSVALLFGPLLLPPPVPRVDMTGKVVLITGANSGIGQSIATDLASVGATVYLGCRNASKAQIAREEILKQYPSAEKHVHTLKLDTSDLDSVRACASAFKQQCSSPIDVLIHNAGISVAPESTPYSPQGFEIMYATNMLGSFLLTYFLEDRLTSDARVISTTSNGQFHSIFSKDFSTTQVIDQREDGFHWRPGFSKKAADGLGISQPLYSNTKAMQCAFTLLLQQRFNEQAKSSKDGKRRLAHCFEPGFTTTNMIGTMESLTWSKDPVFRFLVATQHLLATDIKTGAASGLWLATTGDKMVTENRGYGGGYWARNQRRTSVADLMDQEMLDRFWKRWEADAGVEWR